MTRVKYRYVSQIANPTILEERGALMLAPIFDLLFRSDYLGLGKTQVTIFYKTYKTDDPADMQAIIDQKQAPGKTPNYVH